MRRTRSLRQSVLAGLIVLVATHLALRADAQTASLSVSTSSIATIEVPVTP